MIGLGLGLVGGARVRADLGLGWWYHLQPTTPDRIVATLSRFPPIPIHKVENRSSFPKLRFLTPLHGGEGSVLCMPQNWKFTKSYFDQGCRSGHDKSAV